MRKEAKRGRRQGREGGRVGKEAGMRKEAKREEGGRVGKEAGMRKEAKRGRRQEGTGVSSSAPSRKVLLPTNPTAVRHIFQ